ncbi:MAG TPA: LysE family translocator [Thermoanaerobaculia bacterium]|nr:LysE family translocator [Thermoanaerobaculia bacterium]
MSGSSLILFAAMELVLCLTPGPAVLLVMSQAMRRGFRASFRGALGILTGNAIYFALSAVGLGALLIASTRVFEALRWAGAAYLVVMGLRMIATKTKEAEAPQNIEQRSFVQGVVTQLANPKAIVFFTALLPQFVDPRAGRLALQFFILGVISVVIELPVLAAYGFLADRGRALYGRHGKWVERVAGGFLVAAGVKLAATRS